MSNTKMKVINYYPLDKRTDMNNQYEVWLQEETGVRVEDTSDLEVVKSIQLTEWNVIFFDIETLTPQTSNFIRPDSEEFESCEVKLICAMDSAGSRVYISEDLQYESRENVRVFRCKNPSKTFLRWVEETSKLKPTILSGFNIGCDFKSTRLPGYDLPALFKKANYCPSQIRKTIFTYADRTATHAMISFDQVLVLDLMLYVSVIHSMNSEFKSHMGVCGGLNGMSTFFGVGNKSDCSLLEINRGLCLKAVTEDTRIVVDYCLQDVNLCRLLFNKVGGMVYCDGFLSGAKIPIPLTLGGVQRKTAMLLRFLMSEVGNRQRWAFDPNLPARTTSFDNNMFKGGSVYTRSGIYLLRALLDYNSLYPSVCIEFNICHTTFLGYEEEDADLVTMDLHRIEMSPGYTACFTKQFVGLLPTYMKMCLEERAKYKLLKKQFPNDTLIASIENAWKVFANGAYGATGAHGEKGTFDFYTPITAASITAAGRMMFQKLASVINSLGFDTIYGDTDSQFLSARDSTNTLVETEIVRLVNQHMIGQGYTNIKIAGELGDRPVNILLTGKKKGYCVHKEGKLKTAGFKPSQYSKFYRELFQDTINRILSDGCFTGQHISDFRESIRIQLELDTSALVARQLPNAEGITITQHCKLFSIRRKKQVGMVYTRLSLNEWMAEFLHQYLGYETALDIQARYYTSTMSDQEIANQMLRPCSAWLKNAGSHIEDSRARLVMSDYINDTVKYLFFNPGQIQLIQNKLSLVTYYKQLEDLSFNNCVTIGIRCEKVGVKYLVGIDIDSEHTDRIDWWPVNTLGCKSRRGYHLFYYMDRPPKKREFGNKHSVYGQVEVKTSGAGLSLAGYHRSMEFQYETNSLPIAFISEDTMKELLLCAELECSLEVLRSQARKVNRKRAVGVVLQNTPTSDADTFELPQPSQGLISESLITTTPLITVEQVPREPTTEVITTQSVMEDNQYEYPTEITQLLNNFTFGEEMPVEADDVIDDYVHSYTPNENYSVVEELKGVLFNSTSESWHDYTGYCVPVFLALQSMLTLAELQDIIEYCKGLPNFQVCTNRRKLDGFAKTTNTRSRAKATLCKFRLFTPRMVLRYNDWTTQAVRHFTNTTIKERMTVEDLDVPEPIIAIKAPYGHGKTATVCDYVKQLDPEHSVVVFITNRITQIDSIKSRLTDCPYNVVCQGSQFLPDQGVYLVQYESLFKCERILQCVDKKLYVIIDEAQSFISQIVTTPNKQRFGENQALAWSFINSTHKLILMDGDLTNLSLRYYARDKTVKRYEYTWTQKKYKTEVIDGGPNQLRAEVSNKNKFADTNMLQLDIEIKRCLELGQRIGICSDEKTMTEKYHNALGEKYSFLLINSDNPLKPDTDFSEYRIICWSPSIIHTVSIECPGFDVTFGVFQHRYLEDYKIVNQMHRIRTVNRLVLFIRNLESLTLNPLEVDSYTKRVSYHESVMNKFTPFAMTFHKTGSIAGDSYIIKQTAQAKAIRDLQLRCPRTFERYTQLLLPTSETVELTVLNHETTLRWSWELYPYPIKDKVETLPLNEVVESFGADIRHLTTDKNLSRLDTWLRGKTCFSLATTPEIEMTDKALNQELIDLFKGDFTFLTTSRMYFHEVSVERIIISKITQTERVHEPQIPRMFEEPVIPPIPCVGKSKIEYHILAPGVRCPDPTVWSTEKVQFKCDHFNKRCYVRTFKHPCGSKEHFDGDKNTQPEGEGWRWDRVYTSGCEHRGKRLWIRDRVDWTEVDVQPVQT